MFVPAALVFGCRNYAPFEPIASIGRMAFAVPTMRRITGKISKPLILRKKLPLTADEKQQNNSEKTAA
jgi:hypothetical protein